MKAGLIALAALAAILTACPTQNTGQDRITGISASANPGTLPAGGSSTLSATITGTGNFNAGVNWTILSGGGSLSGNTGPSVTYTAPTTAGSVQVRASAAGDANTSQTLSLTVQAAPPPVITSFTATPGSLPAGGGNVTLAWSVTNATGLSIDGGVGDVTGFSQKTVSLTSSRTFNLSAVNAHGQSSASVDVIVGSPGAQPGVWDQSRWNDANWQ